MATPILYKAIPLSEGSLSLFKKRTDEYSSLKSSLELLMTQPEQNDNDIIDENSSEFIITSERKRLIAKLEKAYSESDYCDLMLPKRAINFMVFNFYETLSSTLSKGAKIRVISQNTEIPLHIKHKLEYLQAYSNFEIKFVNTSFDFGLAICNNREVHIAISNKEVPSLWTNNRQVLKISQMMFENEWNANRGPELIYKKETDPLRIKR